MESAALERLRQPDRERRIVVGGALQEAGQKVDDVIGGQFAGVEPLVREGALDELLEVLSRGFAPKRSGLTHRRVLSPHFLARSPPSQELSARPVPMSSPVFCA